MAAYTYSYTGVGSPSSVRRSDGAEFQQTPGSKLYDDWAAFMAGGGTTSGDETPSIATVRLAAKATLDVSFLAEVRVLTQVEQFDATYRTLRFQEAVAYEADLTPDDADYPLLAAEVPGTAASVDLVHDAVLAELATLKGQLKNLEMQRRGFHDDVDDAADAAAVETVLAGAAYDADTP